MNEGDRFRRIKKIIEIATNYVNLFPAFQKQEEWRIVFWLTLIIYAIAVFFYTLLASGDRQPWAMPRRKEVAVSKENDS